MKIFRNNLILFLILGFSLLKVRANVHSVPTDRNREVIKIGADSLSSLIGQDIESIKIYRYLRAADTWEPIPFQIDVASGYIFSSKESGTLEENDQILFLAQDLGDKADLTQWVDDVEAGNHTRMAITAYDSLTQDSAWIYVYQSPDLPGSEVKYLSYDQEEDWVESQVETAGYFISHGKYGLQDSILFKSSAGGDNIDFFDTQKLRFKIRIVIDLGIFGKIRKTVTITEETRNKTVSVAGVPIDFTFKNISKDYSCSGIIHLQRVAVFEIKVKGSGVNVKENISLATHFYPHYTEWKADEISIPKFDQGKIKMMRFSADLNENAVGMMFYNPYNVTGVRIDGESTPLDQTLEWDYNWYLIQTDPEFSGSFLTTGSILSVMDLQGEPLGDEHQLWFRDDADKDSDDTGDERSYGDVGVEITGNSVDGTLSFLNRTYYIPEIVSYSQAQEEIEKDKHPIALYSDSQYPLHITIIPPQAGEVEVKTLPDSSHLVKLSALPAKNYEFEYWSGDCSDTNNVVHIIMDGPKYITAHFIRLREIVVTTNPAGLNFRADGETFTTPDTFQWRGGSSHTIEIDSLIQPQPDTRYIFSQWSTGENRNFNYTVPEYDEEITGEFISEFKIHTTTHPQDAGSVVLTPSQEWYAQGSLVEFEAFPQGWYAFMRWDGDLSGEENPLTVTIDSSLTVQAVFGNYPPVITLPDTSFNEDDTLALTFGFFDQGISDENNPDSTLKVYFQEGEFVTFSLDSSAKEMKVFTKISDWCGVDSLQVTVEDPLQESDQEYLRVEVRPVNDPPLSFSLLEPADDAEITNSPDSIHFVWQEAEDPDPGDMVKYLFELDTTPNFNSPLLIQEDNVAQNSFYFPGPDSLSHTTYYWQITAKDTSDSITVCDKIFSFNLQSSAVELTDAVPDKYFLQQNYPNPFNARTLIRFGLPEAELVGIYIMNNQGQKVCTLINQRIKSGYHTISWNGRDDQGRIVSSGIYFIVLESGKNWLVRKALFLK